MVCKFCGSKFNAHHCPNCGAPAPEIPVEEKPAELPQYKVGYKRKPSAATRLIAAGVMAIAMLGCCFGIIQFFSISNTATYVETSVLGVEVVEPVSEVEAEEKLNVPFGTQAYLTLTEEEYKASVIWVDYGELKRYPQNYTNTDIAMTIKLSQVDEKNGGTRIVGYFRNEDGTFPNASDGGERRCIFFDYRGEGGPALYEGDEVVLYGEFVEIQIADSLIGRYQVPVANARYSDFLTDLTEQNDQTAPS